MIQILLILQCLCIIEYSDNYSDTSGSLWNFKRDNIEGDVDFTIDNAPSFKYKANLIGNTENNGRKNGVEIAIPLKYLSNFWRSLEMPLINCKVELSLKWHENCILSSAGIAATFKIACKTLCTNCYLKNRRSYKISKLLSDGFKRSIYWNKYKIIFKDYNENVYIRERLDASFQGVNKLFVLPYSSGDNTNENSYRKYFLPRLKIKNYNIEIYDRNFL